MPCERIETAYVDALTAGENPERDPELAEHLAGCTGCRERVHGLVEVWALLGQLPVPEVSHASRRILRNAIRITKNGPGLGKPSVRMTMAAALAGLVLGLGGAWGVGALSGDDGRLAVLQQENRSLRNLARQALDTRASIGVRLAAVSAARHSLDPAITTTLAAVLNTDPSVGVRLAAASALEAHGREDAVGAELAEALRDEPSAHVQLALLRLLSRTRSPAPAIRNFLGRDGLDAGVREEARSVLNAIRWEVEL